MTEFSLSAARARDAVSSIDMTKDERRTTAHVEELWVSLRSAERDRRHLLALVDDLAAEMRRYLPLLEYLERETPSSWSLATMGTGIATLNGYRAALARLEGEANA
jgi:hypothetical protein